MTEKTWQEERAEIVAFMRLCAKEADGLGDGMGAPGDSDRLVCKLQASTLSDYADAIARGEHEFVTIPRAT